MLLILKIMKNYKCRIIKKGPGCEINVARMPECDNGTMALADIEEIKAKDDEQTGEAEENSPEFIIKKRVNDKVKSWIGKSENCSKYMIMSYDGTVVNMLLIDNWYKFSPIIQQPPVKIQPIIKRSTQGSGKKKRGRPKKFI